MVVGPTEPTMGALVGSSLGGTVGTSVGEAVGAFVGAAVGVAVGLAVGDVVGLLPHCELRTHLVVILLVLLPDQLVYLLHLHVVFLHACLERVLDLQCPLRVLDFVRGFREFVLFIVYGRLRLVFGVHWR